MSGTDYLNDVLIVAMKTLEKIKGWFYREKRYQHGVVVKRYFFFSRIHALPPPIPKQKPKKEEPIKKPKWWREEEVFHKLLKYKDVPPYNPPAPKKVMPDNCIWTMWFQGEENAPDIVKMCLASIKSANHGRTIVVLNETNMYDYVDVPEYLKVKLKKGEISLTHFSDIVRLILLATYGGTWLDSTIYQTEKLPEDWVNRELFMFTMPAWHHFKIPASESMIKIICDLYPYHCFSSWFIHANKQNRYICKMLNMLLVYWQENQTLIDYFLMHYFGVIALMGDVECRNIFEEMPKYTRTAAYSMFQYLQKLISDDLYAELCRLSPIHKLWYKFDTSLPVVKDSVLDRLYKKYGDLYS